VKKSSEKDEWKRCPFAGTTAKILELTRLHGNEIVVVGRFVAWRCPRTRPLIDAARGFNPALSGSFEGLHNMNR